MTMILESVLGFNWRQYISAEYVPMHCFTAVCVIAGWALFAPFWSIFITFVQEVWRVVCLNGGMGSAFLTRYQAILKSPELNKLSGPAYAFALWGTMLTVPGEVLLEDEEKYGDYGVVHRAWWHAGKVTFYHYVPDLLLKTSASVGNYARANVGAAAFVWKRVCGAIAVVCWSLLLLLSLLVHIPLAFYDVLEYVCCGGVGVSVAVLMINALNYAFEWTQWGPFCSGVLLVLGLITHAWRQGNNSQQLQDISPATVLDKALESVRESAAKRSRE
jgi:hypothetical protein